MKDEKIVKNQDGGLKVPLSPSTFSNAIFNRCQDLIGS